MGYYSKRFWDDESGGIVTDGLKLWLDASNPLSYPGTGTTWFDLSGNGNHYEKIGTFSNNSIAVIFSGTNYLRRDGVSPINLTPVTLSFWIKFTVAKTSTIYCDRIFTGGLAINKFFTNDTFRFDAGVARTMPHATLLNDWYNITFTYDKITKRLYVNGSLSFEITETSEIVNTTNSVSTIGIANANGGSIINSFVGELGEVIFYNKAINSDEVLQNYNATKSKYGL